MLFIKPFKYESRISWSCMKNKAKLGPDQNCWQLHEPTGRTCLRTSATRTAQLQMILYLQSLPSGVLPGNMTKVASSTMCKQDWDNKTKCWIQLPKKTLNACIIFKSRDTSESSKHGPWLDKGVSASRVICWAGAKTVTTIQHTPEVNGAVLPPYGPLRRLFICFFIPCGMSLSR